MTLTLTSGSYSFSSNDPSELKTSYQVDTECFVFPDGTKQRKYVATRGRVLHLVVEHTQGVTGYIDELRAIHDMGDPCTLSMPGTLYDGDYYLSDLRIERVPGVTNYHRIHMTLKEDV